MKKLNEVMRNYDKISPTFCLAKWLHASIHLLNGTTHSCYLPLTHKIPLEELKKNKSALHNTHYKKLQRKKMLEGERPEECAICWNVEDLPGEQLSDRKMRAVESWTINYLESVKNLAWDADISPTYLEVSFSHLCNFACTYCSPALSSQWEKLVKRDGPYNLTAGAFRDLPWISKKEAPPIDENNNPYIDAFWEWWPDVVKSLHCFRITGGEPLISKHTYRILDWINENPQPHLDLEFNSNLGVPDPHLNRFLQKCVALSKDKKVKGIGLHTSVDTFGKQAEYLRDGLNFQKFQSNVDRLLKELPDASLSFMCTFNNLSIVGFENLLKWIMDLRQRDFHSTQQQRIYFDTPHLIKPSHQNIRILTPEYQLKVKKLIDFMEQNSVNIIGAHGFRENEIAKMKRILEIMKSSAPEEWVQCARKDFYLFFSQYDQRRGKNFLDIFPEMKLFWDTCRHLAETRELIEEHQ